MKSISYGHIGHFGNHHKIFSVIFFMTFFRQFISLLFYSSSDDDGKFEWFDAWKTKINSIFGPFPNVILDIVTQFYWRCFKMPNVNECLESLIKFDGQTHTNGFVCVCHIVVWISQRKSAIVRTFQYGAFCLPYKSQLKQLASFDANKISTLFNEEYSKNNFIVHTFRNKR